MLHEGAALLLCLQPQLLARHLRLVYVSNMLTMTVTAWGNQHSGRACATGG